MTRVASSESSSYRPRRVKKALPSIAAAGNSVECFRYLRTVDLSCGWKGVIQRKEQKFDEGQSLASLPTRYRVYIAER